MEVIMETENGELEVIPPNPDNPDLVKTENGWSLVKKVSPPPTAMEFYSKVVKFHALTRVCPKHGWVSVVDRNFQPTRLLSVEGLSCGHTLLIIRLAGGLKEPCLNITKYVMDNPRNWKHAGWWLAFLNTHKA
jgi:hypothetical protein